jgi:hypothetical protein
MVEAVRGLVESVRIAHWNKPAARTRASTSGWWWASVHIIAFRKGKAADVKPSGYLDHITAAPLTTGHRAELASEVAAWMIEPFAVMMCDPFAGSRALIRAATAPGWMPSASRRTRLKRGRRELAQRRRRFWLCASASGWRPG